MAGTETTYCPVVHGPWTTVTKIVIDLDNCILTETETSDSNQVEWRHLYWFGIFQTFLINILSTTLH